MHLRMVAHQLFHGIKVVQAAWPEALVVPCVLANGNGQPDAVQFHYLLRPRRGKVALFVEDVVERQQALVLLEQHTATIQQNGGVDGRLAIPAAGIRCRNSRLAALTPGRQRHARQHGGRQVAGSLGEFTDGRAAAGQKAGFLKEIGRRVTADHQLGKDREPRALSGRAAGDRDNLF